MGIGLNRQIQFTYNACDSAIPFHHSEDVVRALLGPRGCGKSVSCMQELIKLMRHQEPWRGVRETRMVILRNTYPELTSTTINTWKDWMPEELWPITYSSPITCHVAFPLEDGTKVKCEIMFMSMDKAKDIKKLKSLEATWVYMNEANEMPIEALDMALLSVGRFPPLERGGATKSGLILDANPPDEDHWWYELFEELKPKGYSIYKYPPAMIMTEVNDDIILRPNPDAWGYAKFHKLGYEYWNRAAEGKDREWIKAMVCGQYATTAEGKPVYPEYKDQWHYSPNLLEIYPGLPILMGWDLMVTALQPAVVFAQMSPRGQLRILGELVGQDMGIRQFTHEAVLPYITSHFPGYPLSGWGDPAGKTASGTDDRTCYDVLKEAGLDVKEITTNKFTPRRESVSKFLLRAIDGEPGIVFDDRSPILRRGMIGKYCYKRVNVAGHEKVFSVEPDKRSCYSHPQDGLQYLCFGLNGADLAGVKQNRRPRSHRRPVVVSSSKGWT